MFDIQKIEKARILKGWTKGELAQRSGIHPSTYTLIVKGNGSSPKTIKAICDVLGLEMEDVYIGADCDPAQTN